MFRGLSKLRSERSGSQGSLESRRTSGNKNELAITAPKQIVRALYPYKAQHYDELTFNKNDFFYVINEPNSDWYIASNPLANVTGLIPQSYFEVIQRQDPQAVPISQARRAHSRSASAMSAGGGPEIIQRHGGSAGRSSSGAISGHRPSASQSSRGSSRRASLAIYGFVLYDFQAERNDELTVAAGESIVIVAQSTEEWFVAKPIGRLGGPGLIPVSYVELREVGSDQPLTDVADTIRRANLPQVDEWKRRLAEYKASSIPLGRFGTTSEQLEHSQSSSQSTAEPSRAPSAVLSAHSMQSAAGGGAGGAGGSTGPSGEPGYDVNAARPYGQQQISPYAGAGAAATATTAIDANTTATNTSASEPSSHTPLYVISATVDRFAVNGGRYWYLVKVEMSNGKYRNLCRYYQDFYDFQIKLLEQFPDEAGRTGKPRTLPFMPGPLTLVTHTVSSQRRANLDDYVRDLIRMPPRVSQSSIVLQLFSIRPGDVESSEATQQLPQPPQSETDQQYSGDMPSLAGSSENSNTNTSTGANNTTINNGSTTSNTHPSSSSYNSYSTTPANGVGNAYSRTPSQSGSTGNNSPYAVLQQQRESANYSRSNQYANESVASTPASTSASTSAPTLTSSSTNPYGKSPYGDGREPTNYSTAQLSQPSLKIKVYANPNVIAIRVPVETPFSEVYDKIATRLSMPSPKLYTNADCIGEPVDNAAKFARSLNGGTKIALYLGN